MHSRKSLKHKSSSDDATLDILEPFQEAIDEALELHWSDLDSKR